MTTQPNDSKKWLLALDNKLTGERGILSNPKRANEEYALPNVETFYVHGTCAHCGDTLGYDPKERPWQHRSHRIKEWHTDRQGWYWQPCFPGCLPDGEPNGPFATEQEAIEDAQSVADDDADDLPPCAVAMGCLCAGHARGNPASQECDTRETVPCGDAWGDAVCVLEAGHTQHELHTNGSGFTW